MIGLERRIVAVKRRTIGADIFVIVTHVAKDMGMIKRRHGPDAHEFLGADLDFVNANVIVEMRNDRVGHARDCVADDCARCRKAPYRQEFAPPTAPVRGQVESGSVVKKAQMPASYGRFGT